MPYQSSKKVVVSKILDKIPSLGSKKSTTKYIIDDEDLDLDEKSVSDDSSSVGENKPSIFID